MSNSLHSLFNFASQSEGFWELYFTPSNAFHSRSFFFLNLYYGFMDSLLKIVPRWLLLYSTSYLPVLEHFFADSICSVITEPDSAIYIEPWPVPQFIGYARDIITFLCFLIVFLNPFYTQMNSTIFFEVFLYELVNGQILPFVLQHPPMNVVTSANVHYLCTGAGMGGPYNIDTLYVGNLADVVVTPTFLQQACTYVFHFQAWNWNIYQGSIASF